MLTSSALKLLIANYENSPYSNLISTFTFLHSQLLYAGLHLSLLDSAFTL